MSTDHHHHDDDLDHDPQLRIRLYLGGRLQDETWLRGSDPDLAPAAARLHAKAVDAAASEGVTTWLLEVYDPEAPEESAYLRIGTDTAGMVDPRPLFGGLATIDGAT